MTRQNSIADERSKGRGGSPGSHGQQRDNRPLHRSRRPRPQRPILPPGIAQSFLPRRTPELTSGSRSGSLARCRVLLLGYISCNPPPASTVGRMPNCCCRSTAPPVARRTVSVGTRPMDSTTSRSWKRIRRPEPRLQPCRPTGPAQNLLGPETVLKDCALPHPETASLQQAAQAGVEPGGKRRGLSRPFVHVPGQQRM